MNLRVLSDGTGGETHIIDTDTGREMNGVRWLRWWIGSPPDDRADRPDPDPAYALTEAGHQFLESHAEPKRRSSRLPGRTAEVNLTFHAAQGPVCFWSEVEISAWLQEHSARRHLVSLGRFDDTALYEDEVRLTGIRFCELVVDAGCPGKLSFRQRLHSGESEEFHWTDEFSLDVRIGTAPGVAT